MISVEFNTVSTTGNEDAQKCIEYFIICKKNLTCSNTINIIPFILSFILYKTDVIYN